MTSIDHHGLHTFGIQASQQITITYILELRPDLYLTYIVVEVYKSYIICSDKI